MVIYDQAIADIFSEDPRQRLFLWGIWKWELNKS